MKIDLIRTERKFKKVLQDNFEECLDVDFKSDELDQYFDKLKFEKGGGLYQSFWWIFIAGIRYGYNIRARKK